MKRQLFDKAQAAIQKQRDKVKQSQIISSSFVFKENVDPYQGIRQTEKYLKIQKKLESIKNKGEQKGIMITDEDCEVEVADERDDQQQSIITHHQILKMREHGLFPLKVV